jgi:hypothetical protein
VDLEDASDDADDAEALEDHPAEESSSTMLQKTVESRLKKDSVDNQNNNRKCFCRHLVYMEKPNMLRCEKADWQETSTPKYQRTKSTMDNFRNCDCIRGMTEDAELKL